MSPQPSQRPITLELTDATNRLTKAQMNWLAEQCTRALHTLRCAGSLRVRVIDDVEMAKAHEEFAGVPGTTDVLTFDMTDPDDADQITKPLENLKLLDQNKSQNTVDTDIMICLDEAIRQASQRGYDFPRELLLYVVHGLLHCLGHDDHEEQDAALMHRVEDAVLEAIGVGAVFRRGEQ
ncbi:MAG: rRNA maturation RNase YbeY [Phycisphaerales bacterium]